jgi:hypothetical protein
MKPDAQGYLEGKDALDFAEKYLRKGLIDSQNWEIEYENPDNGDKWIMTYPDSEAHGGGSPLLTKVR